MKNLLVLVLLFLSACNARLFIDQSPGNEGQLLAVGESANVRFFTNNPAAESGLQLASGSNYQVEFTLVSNWIDGSIDKNENGQLLDETGFGDELMPSHVLSLLKRSRQHRWFEMMLYQDGCARDSLTGITELSVDGNTGSYIYPAVCSGDLKMFVNDSQGFYSNNAGVATIRVTRTN